MWVERREGERGACKFHSNLVSVTLRLRDSGAAGPSAQRSSPNESMSWMTNQTNSSGVERPEAVTVPLQLVGGTGENGDAPCGFNSQKFSISRCLDSLSQRITSLWPFCRDRDHRRLAIYSVVCGLSCVGATALIFSVKARERRRADPESAQIYSDKARSRALVSILLCLALPFLIAAVVIFASYLLTFVN
ncbi:hypothetical protein AALO_G00081160 [Alosa alosa]|uniref:Uncharacterized protein n=1 Tax=Alosa alosa TaxID=278164 RepID=A0AAV6H1A4_9TELE|nr:hypothetical protein AALO_G00081160 [Alosa alosa]